MVVSLQMQIYLVAGISGIVCGSLIVTVITLFVALEQLRRRFKLLEESVKTDGNVQRRIPVVINGHENYAFTEPEIKPGEELSRRGYVMSSDQIVPPRLHRMVNGMYGAVLPTHDNNLTFDTMDGTRDASEDFVLNPVHKKSNLSQLQNPAARQLHSSNDHLNDLASFPSDQQRRRSQFNNNIMLSGDNHNTNYTSSNHLQSRNIASTEFPSIDYDDIVSSSSNYYGETGSSGIRNDMVVDDRRKQQHY